MIFECRSHSELTGHFRFESGWQLPSCTAAAFTHLSSQPAYALRVNSKHLCRGVAPQGMQLGPQLEQALLQQLDCLSQLVRGARLADEAEDAPTTAVGFRLGSVQWLANLQRPARPAVLV